MELFLSTVLTGVGASLLMDAWTVIRHRWLGIPPLDFAMVGRWIGHMPRGRYVHHPISASRSIVGERALGWIAHYLIGIAFAGLLPVMAGVAWFCHPTIAPALVAGIAGVVAPFFIMQPAFGLGIAASRSPRPAFARVHSLLNHAMFGLGLYATGELLHLLPIRMAC